MVRLSSIVFFSSGGRHTSCLSDWSSDVCSSDLIVPWSIGTMGAFIRLRTVVSDRRQLLDVGIAGPIAGLVVALPVLAIGLAMSHAPYSRPSPSGMMVVMGASYAYIVERVHTIRYCFIVF